MRRDAPADPVRRSKVVPAVALVELLDGARGGDPDVDGLAALRGEPVERVRGDGDELGVARLLPRVADEDATGYERPRTWGALHETVPLERADEARGRALRQSRARRELADGRRLRRLEDGDEELRRAVDRLRSRGLGVGTRSHIVELIGPQNESRLAHAGSSTVAGVRHWCLTPDMSGLTPGMSTKVR